MKDDKELENTLYNTGKYLYNKNKKFIPDKTKFLNQLEEELKQLETKNIKFQKHKNYNKPITNIKEQILTGKKNYYWFGSIAAGIILFIGIGIIIRFNDNNTKQNPMPAFGGSLKEKNIPELPDIKEKDIYDQIEKQLLEKIQKEEDPQIKEQYIQELIQFYKKTNQEEKIQMLLNRFE
ncbi:MAG: hypothetical protein KatS3mg129_0579 [Leptospiraceae bacterium]|nr:MAG: hypothetical protein KatS3mg129_0579 [Leptospiraceae bacterium]